MRHIQQRDLTIRPATDADRPRLFDLWLAAVRATHDFLSADDLAEITAMVRTEFFPVAPFTVATGADGIPLGFIHVEGRTEISALFVDPACHGQGIGRALIAAALPPDEPLSVEVNEQNHAARAVYEHWGFRQIGRKDTDGQGRPYPLIVLSRD